ncbi:MAG: hypothetical protein NT009_05365 [Proteobacteria bacterium]|nr:hypothetical protein [Pseudomonadota bacterium]
MKKNNKIQDRDEMRKEYDFRGGVRGKYAQRLLKSTNLVKIDSDILEVFPDSESINRALRSLADIIREQHKSNNS